MAKFLAYYNLCPIHDTKEFLGVSKDHDDSNIITTLGRNIIIVVKLTNQKQIHSWTVLDKLSSKVVYNKKTNNYVGVFANKYIRCWDENVRDLNKVKKLKFKKNIVELIEYDEIIVLYSNGTCESLSSAINTRTESNITTSSNVLNHNSVNNFRVFDLYDDRKMLTYFYKNDKTDTIELVTIYLNEIDLKPLEEPRVYKLERPVQNVTLSGYTVVEGHNFPELITIWSDKRIFRMALDDNISINDVPGNILSMVEILNVNNPLSVHGISKNCITIYGANSGQEGASLILYNTQFKVVKAKQFFKIYFDFSRLWVIGSHILLAMGQNLSVVSFRVSKELLSELIGSQASSNTQSNVVDFLINEEYELEEAFEYSNSTDNNDLMEITNENFNDKSMRRKKADGKTIPFKSYYDFQNDFNDLCSHNFNVEILSSNIPNDEIKINLLSNFYDNGIFQLEEIEIIAEELKKCGSSEQEISEKLLTILIKVEHNEDIAGCLRRYSNISEKMLTKTLKYALTDFNVDLIDNCNTTIKQNGISSIDENNIDINFICGEQENLDLLLNKPIKINIKTRNDLINLILSCSFDTKCISRYIRKEIDLNEALILLKHLYNLIISKENCLEECHGSNIDFDEDSKIFQWFGILLNTHFQKLALSRDVDLINLLLKWNEILIQYKQQLKELEEFSSVLYNLINQEHIYKKNKSSKWYSIEEVKLF